MAMFALRARRALGSLSAVHRSLSGPLPAFPAAQAPVLGLPPSSPSSVPFLHPSQLHSRTFRSPPPTPPQGSYIINFDDYKNDPDAFDLFYGFDDNHWLITVTFPGDPKPTPEEMVRTYEEICAKGLNISVEEAKKRIYACSTTTYSYRGFQAVMTEAEAQQFRGIPGVDHVLPDCYVDPLNKEYGGEKYENGVITHRPRPRPRRRRRGCWGRR